MTRNAQTRQKGQIQRAHVICGVAPRNDEVAGLPGADRLTEGGAASSAVSLHRLEQRLDHRVDRYAGRGNGHGSKHRRQLSKSADRGQFFGGDPQGRFLAEVTARDRVPIDLVEVRSDQPAAVAEVQQSDAGCGVRRAGNALAFWVACVAALNKQHTPWLYCKSVPKFGTEADLKNKDTVSILGTVKTYLSIYGLNSWYRHAQKLVPCFKFFPLVQARENKADTG